ncbi:MAG: MerR family transcriptional regulator [Chthoniobacter sp.]
MSLWEPEPDALYTLEHVAQLAGVPRRRIVLYARHGLMMPATESGAVGWYFTAEAVRTLLRIERLRALHRLDLPSVRLVLELIDEVERLRAALRFSTNW